MKYTISNLHYTVSDIDDDVIEFNYDVHITEPEEMFIDDYYLHYSYFIEHLKSKHPEFYKYIDGVRSGVDGWGPCERRMMEALEEEAAKQLFTYVEEYLLTDFDMQAVYDWHKKWSSGTIEQQIEKQQQAEKAYNDLSSYVPAARRSTNRYRNFCEDATKALRTITLDVFPEVADMDAEKLKEFKYLYVNEIISMTDTLEKFLSGKGKYS
jgi:hypothetical protein